MNEEIKNIPETPHGFATDAEANDALAERFHKEITALRDQEIQQAKQKAETKDAAIESTGNLLDERFNIEDLALIDKQMWSKIRDKTVTADEFASYREQFENPETAQFINKDIAELAADQDVLVVGEKFKDDPRAKPKELPFSSRRAFFEFFVQEYLKLDLERQLEALRKARAAKKLTDNKESSQ